MTFPGASRKAGLSSELVPAFFEPRRNWVVHAVAMTRSSSSATAFFDLVDELLTPAMSRLGCQRICGYENDQPSSRGILTRSRGSRRSRRSRRVQDAHPFLLYDVGFEALSNAVQQRVLPGDPQSADELWLSYDPRTGELELQAWTSIAVGRVDWDSWLDTTTGSDLEVRRRLTVMGTAVDDFTRATAKPPSGG